MSKRILVKGAYGSCNFGDDMLLLALNQLFNTPSFKRHKFYFEVNNQKYLNLISDKKINMKYHDEILNPDCVIYGGGTQVFSFDFIVTKNNGMHERIIRAVKNPIKIIFLLRSHILKKSLGNNSPVIGLGLGFGPFQNNKIAKKKITSKLGLDCPLLIVRDQTSHDYAITSGYSPVYASDLCFLNELKNFLPHPRSNNIDNINRVAVIMRDWPDDSHGGLTKDNIINITKLFKKRKVKLVFVSFSVFHDEYFRQLTQEHPHIYWSPSHKHSIINFLDELNAFDLIISSRYHGLVFSTLLEIPFIGINIEPKILNYVKNSPLEKLLWPPPFNVNELLVILDKVTKNYSSYKDATIMLKKNNNDLAKIIKPKLLNSIESL